ncbi:MAG: hypothetical protein R3A52_28710 [Polyangiales bacterium]
MERRPKKIAAVALAAAAGCGVEPNPREPVDAFAGARVLASSRFINPEAVIDGEVSRFNAAFGDDGTVNSPVSVEVETPATVSATALRVYAESDGAEYAHRRSMSGFTLDADADGDGTYESRVFERVIPIDYRMVPDNAAPPTGWRLDLTVTFAAVRARRWRFTAYQGVGTARDFEGIRVHELVLYATE